ncbi:tetratricopeptide repeat protein, partial [bacterium]|nr:tetratricopeptide repeat protein [bacterium]
IVYEDVIGHGKKLYDQGLHAELQRYAQRKLASNYSDIELRRILAKSLLESGSEQMAIMHYEAILTISPRDTEAQEFLAEYYTEHGPKNRAIDLYEKIYAYDSGNINAVETLAKLYEETNNFPKAIEMYKLILDAEVDETRITELKYTLAELYTKVGDNLKAFEAYEKIYLNDTENLEILMILADLAYKNKYWQDCLKFYQKITSIVGDDFEMLEKIAQLYVTLERWDEAVIAYKKIISLENSDSSNYLYHQNELCNALLKNNQSDEAISILKDLISQNPKETSFIFTLAQAYAIAGEFQSGLNLYNKLLDELPPEQGEIIIKYISNIICAWAQDLFSKGEYNQAFDKFFEAIKYNEENDDVYYQLGKCNYYIKSIQDSISHFKRAIALKPQESKYYFGLGCAYDEMGSIKNAKSAFHDAINIDPMNIKARIAYAITLTKELEYAQSVEQFLEVLKYIPDNADTLYNTALAYELIGDTERAIKYYKKAIDVNPEHKEAKHNIELILGEPYIPEIPAAYVDDNKENIEQSPSIEPAVEATSAPAIEENKQEDLDFDFDIPTDNGDNQGSMFS